MRVPPAVAARASSIEARVGPRSSSMPAEQPDAHALLHQVRGVVADGGVEQREERLDLVLMRAASSRG